MALRIDVEFKGLSVSGAYVSVMQPMVTADKNEISFGVWYRASPLSSEAFDAVTFTAPYTIDGENPFVQAYEYLKSQPSFQGCIDC